MFKRLKHAKDGSQHLCRLYRLRRPHRSHRPRRRSAWMCMLAVCAAALLTLTAGCQTNPVTGKTQLNLVPMQQEIAIGQQHAPEYVEAFGREIDDPAVRRYVDAIGQRMAALSHLPDLPWTFYVVDSDVINAFAMPGGHVFVTRGLLEIFENESELAAVLGHEIGHVTHRHGAQQMTRAATLDVGLAVGARAAGLEGERLRQVHNIGAQVGTVAFLLPYSRSAERESDEVGVEYMVAAGYDPRGMVALLEKLARAAGGARPPLILSTHPHPEDRAEAVRRLIDRRYAAVTASGTLRIGESDYQQHVLTPLSKLPPPRHKGGQ
jgi:predicted Zn-dependent protease